MINGLTYNDLAAECHANNARWWHDLETGERLERDKDELLMLVVSEIAEALEAERKGLMDDKLPHRPGAEVELIDCVIRLADFAGGLGYDITADASARQLDPLPVLKSAALFEITKMVTHLGNLCVNGGEDLVGFQLHLILERIKEYAEAYGYDLDGAYVEKSEFNKIRKDHSAEARKATGGKKF